MSTSYAGATAMLSAIKDAAPLYLALYTAIPGKTGGGQEVVASSYQRQEISFGPVADGEMNNTNLIQYPQAMQDWGRVTSWAVCDTQTGGTLLWYGEFSDPAVINRGSYFFVDPDGITLVVD